jgi:hypothetical protein
MANHSSKSQEIVEETRHTRVAVDLLRVNSAHRANFADLHLSQFPFGRIDAVKKTLGEASAKSAI